MEESIEPLRVVAKTTDVTRSIDLIIILHIWVLEAGRPSSITVFQCLHYYPPRL